MKLYTSYFAQLRNFPQNLVGLSTAHWNPKWLQPNRDKNGALWLDIPPLKPGPQCDGLCAGNCAVKKPQECQFLKVYREQLNQLDFNVFITKLEHLAKQIQEGENLSEVNFAFLVYETPQNPCSERHVIQEWFNDNGVQLEEFRGLPNSTTERRK